MKKLIYSVLLFLFISALMFNTSCSKSNETSMLGKSEIMVDLKYDLSFKGEDKVKSVNSRSINEEEYKNILNYTVSLFKTTGENIYSAKYRDWGLAYEVESNVEYRLEAAYGNPDFKASYDELYVYGSETFSLTEGDTKKVVFLCKPQAVKAKLFLSEDFMNYFKECSVSFKTKHLESPFKMTLADKDKELFLFENTEDDIVLTFDLLDKNGKMVNQSKTVRVSPQTFLKIKMSPDVTEVEGGKFGLDITVSTDVTDENINIIIPNDKVK